MSTATSDRKHRERGDDVSTGRAGPVLALAAGVALGAGCGDSNAPSGPDGDAAAGFNCTIDENQIYDGGVGRGGIPALSDPELVPVGGENTGYLQQRVSADPDTRVVGLEDPDGRPMAVPLRLLWWHEIANFDFGDRQIAVTLCPLTGSTLVFDRDAVDGREFVVSGLLFLNNLMMAPEDGGQTLFPQMSRGARCGPARGTELEQIHAVEMSWQAWKELHPDTRVVSSATDVDRDYTRYPYGEYNDLDNSETLFPVPRIDGRRPPKERVLGIPSGEGGLAVPFGALSNTAEVVVDSVRARGGPIWIFWESRAKGAAAYRPRAELPSGRTRTLGFERDGRKIVDRETGSTWTLDGRAVAGPLEGAELQPVKESYVAFWFAWALFQPDTEIWESPAGSDTSG